MVFIKSYDTLIQIVYEKVGAEHDIVNMYSKFIRQLNTNPSKRLLKGGKRFGKDNFSENTQTAAKENA